MLLCFACLLVRRRSLAAKWSNYCALNCPFALMSSAGGRQVADSGPSTESVPFAGALKGGGPRSCSRSLLLGCRSGTRLSSWLHLFKMSGPLYLQALHTYQSPAEYHRSESHLSASLRLIARARSGQSLAVQFIYTRIC